MSLFIKTSKSELLTKRSNNILKVFTETVDNLEEVNQLILEEQSNKEEEINKLTQELESLKKTGDANFKVIGKIRQFFLN